MGKLWFHRTTKKKNKFFKKEKQQKAVIGVLAFEVARVMSRLLHLWTSLSDEQVNRLRQHILNSVGIEKLVSDDNEFILGLISSELFENVVTMAKYVARLGKNHSSHPSLKAFEHAISDWIHNGVDPYGWQLSWEKMEREANMMKEFISKNADLYDKMKLLSDLEHTLKDITATLDGPILLEFQNKVELKRHEVENLKEVSLWNTTYDYVGIILATSVFTIVSRIKHVFGLPKLRTDAETKDSDHISPSPSIFSKHKLLDAPPDTLGAAALALHYANIILKIETLVLYPSRCHRVDRNDLYSMLPGSIRAELNERLPCIEGSTLSLPCIESTTSALQDLPKLEESIQATIKTIEWVSPLAHNMKKWQCKRNIQQKAQKASVFSHPVLLVQTLYFANHQNTEATITDLLVGMHYTYNLKRQVKAKSMLERRRNSLKIKADNLEAQDKALVSIDGDQTV